MLSRILNDITYVNVYFVRRNAHGVSRVNLIQILLITHVSHMWRAENRRSVSVTSYIFYIMKISLYFLIHEDYNILMNDKRVNSIHYSFLKIDISILIRKRFLFTLNFLTRINISIQFEIFTFEMSLTA